MSAANPIRGPFRLFAAICLLAFVIQHALAATPPRFSASVSGTGPDVILIPGLASPAATWDAVAADLAPHHRVHVVQVAGFAGAPVAGNASGPVLVPLAEALAAYITDHHLDRPAVIGHSLGGELALMLASRHPDLVGRVMAVDSLPYLPLLFSPQATPASVAPMAAAMRDRTMAQTPAAFAAGEQSFMGQLVKAEPARTTLAAAAAKSDPGVTARAMYDGMMLDLRPELARITVPLTVVYAWDTQYGVPATATDATFRSAYAGVPHLTLVRIDDSFHFIMADQPARFAAAVKTFLQ